MEEQINENWFHLQIIRESREVLYHSIKTVDGVCCHVVESFKDGEFKELSRTPADQLTA